MNYAYLGFIETLQSIVNALVDNIVSPILSKILLAVIAMIGEFLQKALGKLFLLIFCLLLRIIDMITVIYDIASGITPVVFNNEEMSLVEAMLNIQGVGRVFWLFTAIAMVMTFLFTIISVLRSIGDSVMENKRPVSHAIKQGIRSSLMFFMIPMLCLVMLQLSNIVLKTVNKIDYSATVPNQNEIIITGTTTGDVLFSAMMTEAMKFPPGVDTEEEREDFQTKKKAAYLTRQPGPTSEIYTYENMDQVLEDYDYMQVNYVIAIVVALVMIIIILLTCITLIKRCFDILILYLVSPFFAASMAYDDGKMFKEWQEAFVAKFFAGLGNLVSMKLYLILIPFIVNNRFQFVNNTFINTLLTTLFALGGMWATYKSNTLLTQILDPDVAEEEAQRSAMIKGMAIKAMIGGM